MMQVACYCTAREDSRDAADRDSWGACTSREEMHGMAFRLFRVLVNQIAPTLHCFWRCPDDVLAQQPPNRRTLSPPLSSYRGAQCATNVRRTPLFCPPP